MYVEKKKNIITLVIHCYPTFVKIDSVSRMQSKGGGILYIFIIYLEERIFYSSKIYTSWLYSPALVSELARRQ